MQNKYFKIKTIILLLFISFNGFAQYPPYCASGTHFVELDINNVRTHFRAGGGMFYDRYNNDYKYEVPKGSGVQHINTFDFWMSATDEFEQKRIDYQWYSYDGSYFSGPLDDEGFTDVTQCERYDRIWKINKTTLDSFRLGLFEEIPTDILEWPAKGNPNLSFEIIERDSAPFVDVNNDEVYNAFDGDYPEILGDQALWWIFNDMGSRTLFNYLPLQCDVKVMAYAYNSIPELQNHTFYKYTITNKAVGRLDSVMLGMFLDTDIGQWEDDFVGCDTLRSMGIAYNGDDFDGTYGNENIPMMGLKLLQGPQKKDGTFSDMYTFWFRQSGPFIWDYPFSLEGVCNALWGLYENGLPMTYGGYGYGNGDGKVTLFKYPSDPTDENGWSECSEEHTPSDRTMFMSVGPFSMERYEQKELHFAVLWVNEGIEYPCPSFAPIQEAADYVQDLFDNGLITNIEEEPIASIENTHLQLFPNPLKGNRILRLQQTSNSTLQKGRFQLYDNLGRLVESATLQDEKETELQLSELSSGVYFYRLQWENGGVENGKLVVEW